MKKTISAALIGLLFCGAAYAQTIDNATFVTVLYLTYLHRAPAASEVTFYVNEITSGAATQASVLANFLSSPEFVAVNQAVLRETYAGAPTDVSSASLTRNGTAGGSAGFVNSAIRATTNVPVGEAAFEWSVLGIVNSSSASGENVGVYGQGNGLAAGPIWGGVMEAHSHAGGTAVGLEVDSGCISGGNCVGVDVVRPAGQTMTSAVRTPCGIPALVSPNDLTSYIVFPCSGGVQVVSHGVVVQTW